MVQQSGTEQDTLVCDVMTQKELLDALADGDSDSLRQTLASDEYMTSSRQNQKTTDVTDEQTTLMRLCHIRYHGDRAAAVSLALRRPSADVTARDERGRTALMHACMTRRVDVVQLLARRSDCDPNATDNKGRTALMYAVTSRSEALLKTLLRHCPDIDVNTVNTEGQSAMQLAEQQGVAAVTEALLSFCGYDECDGDISPIAEQEDSWDATDYCHHPQSQYTSRGQGHYSDKVKYEWSASAPPVLESDKGEGRRERHRESHVMVDSVDVSGKVKVREKRKKAAALSLPNLPAAGHRLTSDQPTGITRPSQLSLSLTRLPRDYDDSDDTSMTSRRGQNQPLLPTLVSAGHRQPTARISLRGCAPVSRDNRLRSCVRRDVGRGDDSGRDVINDTLKLPRI